MTKRQPFTVPNPDHPFVVGELDEAALTRLYVENFDYLGGAHFNGASALVHLLELRGYRCVHAQGRLWVEGFTDPKVGATTITAAGTPCVYVKAGHYFEGQRHNTVPTSLFSAASTWSARPSEVLRMLVSDDEERRELIEKHFPGAVPRRTWFYRAQYGDSWAVDRHLNRAVKRVLPVEVRELAVQLTCIAAFDEDHALTLAQLDVPKKAVRITPKGEVAELGWHGQRPTAQEQFDYDRVALEEKHQREAEIAREVRQFHEAKRRAAGL